MRLLIDSSYLYKNHLEHPEFQKLLQLALSGAIEILIPQIVWDEHRTQMLKTAIERVGRLRDAIQTINNSPRGNLVLGKLRFPQLDRWTDEDLYELSVEAVTTFAEENNIHVIPMDPAHASRAWDNYFRAGPPFKKEESRENRRKDIPDSWIFEVAKDLISADVKLLALCDDTKLTSALRGLGVEVFQTTQDLVERLSGEQQIETPIEDQTTDLSQMLMASEAQFADLNRRVLGFISFLGTPAKSELFEPLAATGIESSVAENVANRLVITGFVEDTGNHYIAKSGRASQLAAQSVEQEVIAAMGIGAQT
jgi:hypothetical protein